MEYKTTAVIIFMTVTNSAALAPLPYFPSTDNIPAEIQQQYEDNLRWLGEADKHEMVVGSQARILYSDQVGRVKIAKAFNEAVATGKLKVSQVLCQILVSNSCSCNNLRLLRSSKRLRSVAKCERHYIITIIGSFNLVSCASTSPKQCQAGKFYGLKTHAIDVYHFYEDPFLNESKLAGGAPKYR